MPDRQPEFRVSSYCQDGGCVGVSLSDANVIVRNTVTGDAITFSPDEWTAFIAGVKANEFDLNALSVVEVVSADGQ